MSREPNMTVEGKIQIIEQLLTGFLTIMASDIASRDIKPDNILFKWDNDTSPLIVMADFGLSRIGVHDPSYTLAGYAFHIHITVENTLD